MKFSPLIVFTFLSLIAFAQNVSKVVNPVDLINPLMGTESKPSLSNGNTYPAIALP